MNDTHLHIVRIGERENGYLQCHNDVLLILIQSLAENPSAYYLLNSVRDRMVEQLEIRKVTAYAHTEEIVNPELPL